MAGNRPAVDDHFRKSAANVAATYSAILRRARRFGPVQEQAKKTSIHLVRKTAFAGVAVQKQALVLTLKSAKDVRSKRLKRKLRMSANRWYIEVRLAEPKELDEEVLGWLEQSYALAG